MDYYLLTDMTAQIGYELAAAGAETFRIEETMRRVDVYKRQVQAYRYFVDPQTTTLVYAYSSEDAIAATGYFARNEQVIACSETLLELERAEGRCV